MRSCGIWAGRRRYCLFRHISIDNKIVNSLEEFTDDDYRVDTDQDNAEINVEFTGKLSEEGNLLLKSLILGLTSIEEEQDQYLDVIFKEV